MLAEPRGASALLSSARQSLSRCRRIRNRTEFDQLLKAASVANKWFAIYIKENTIGMSRLGVVASKRIMPTAVSRNFAKRLVREVFRRNFSADNAIDVVIRAKNKLDPDNSLESRKALIQLLQKVQMR